MWMSRLAVALVLALAFTAIPTAPAQAQTVRVIVDGSPVFFDQPPVVIGGRTLIPLRGVFEQMGATVQWNPVNDTVLAMRGTTQVQLTIGSRSAWVNGQQVALDVPPMIINGRTLVPLRFIGESLGANVQWLVATRTVLITSPVSQPPQAPPRVVQPPQPVPSQTTIEGTVFRVDAANQRLYVQRGNTIHTVIITQDTAITRVNAVSGQGGAVSLAEIRAGDQVTVTMDAQSRALLVRAQVREVTGRIDVISGRTLVLENGQVYTLLDDARIIVNGREVSRSALQRGMEVTLRISPTTGQVLEVAAQGVAQPPPDQPSTDQPRITSFTHNATRALRAGETLTVELRGTRGGQATFDIFNVASGIPMREVSSGVYRGTFTVRPGDNVANAAMFGHLRVGGQETAIQGGVALTIDSQAPAITGRFPQPGAVVENVRPNILITFVDQGAGVNPQASTLTVNGQNVTANTTVTETAIAYVPPSNLPQGAVSVRAVIGDRAGNATTDTWAFTIGVAQGSLIRAVTVNPTTPLQAGQTLTVTAVGEPGSQATFSIAGVVDNIPMVETQPGFYVGQFTVGPQHNVQSARVVVTMVRGGQTSRVEATSRLTLIGQQAPSPRIVTPTAGTQVGAPIVIRGTATPGSRVVVRVDYQGTLLLFNVRGTYGEVSTTADAAGNWQVSLNPSIRIPNARLTITARAVDPVGRESAPAQVQVIQS